MKVYQKLFIIQEAKTNCEENGAEYVDQYHKHHKTIETILENAPSGSGFDSGTEFLGINPNQELVFKTSFHHMDEMGGYDGWTEHGVKIIPHLGFGFHIKISGTNKNDIKEYISDVFHEWLNAEYVMEKVNA